MGGALNARPTRLEAPVPSVERDDGDSRISDSLSDRPPIVDTYERSGDRYMPESPIVLTDSGRGGSDTESDHTIEHLRTPLASQYETRTPPRPHPANYMPTGKSPTMIFADQPNEVYPYHHRDDEYERRLPMDVHGDPSGRPIYYIIPGGVNVIFQDERGHEITRVGDFNRRQPSRPAPFVVQDAQGQEIYRYDSSHSREGPYRHSEPQIVRIDAYQSDRPRYARSYSSQSTRSDSYRRRHDHHSYRDFDRSESYAPHGSERSRSSHRSYSHSNMVSVDRPASRQHSQDRPPSRQHSHDRPASRQHSQSVRLGAVI
ncbi:hypothetical protein BV22DRAFT_656774 [Leucogyrophana mollusca]|uniref:Uncharacterized protein n=1 Tax=Leucogyrophana mollusca TaxID=85980 RepID=A0ACB8BB36_9AGAM|nr:hypothetical protein BV22DRAFT_656774 [Leucogyrophana mollusca]